MILTIHAFGRPAPQGSKRGGTGGVMLEQSTYLPAWRQAVKVAAYRAYEAAGIDPLGLPVFPAGTPVMFRLIEFRMVPSVQAMASPPGCAIAPTGAPDVDKLLRSTLDALGGRTDPAKTARLFHDDAQVVEIQSLRKVWASIPEAAGALIIVSDGRD